MDGKPTNLLSDSTLQRRLDPREWFESIRPLFDGPQAAWQSLSHHLAELDEWLQQRFAQAEEAGRFEEALFFAPWFASQVESSRRQQRDLLRRLQYLRVQQRVKDDSPGRWRQLQEEFDAFVEEFLDHEAEKHNLLLEAYSQEDGSQ